MSRCHSGRPRRRPAGTASSPGTISRSSGEAGLRSVGRTGRDRRVDRACSARHRRDARCAPPAAGARTPDRDARQPEPRPRRSSARASAARPSEFGKFGEPTDAKVRAAMLDEGLDLLRRFWSGEKVTHDGEHYTVDGVTLAPAPVQERVPVWIGGNRPASLRRAARWDGWLADSADPTGMTLQSRRHRLEHCDDRSHRRLRRRGARRVRARRSRGVRAGGRDLVARESARRARLVRRAARTRAAGPAALDRASRQPAAPTFVMPLRGRRSSTWTSSSYECNTCSRASARAPAELPVRSAAMIARCSRSFRS